jgi:hypothetical protein
LRDIVYSKAFELCAYELVKFNQRIVSPTVFDQLLIAKIPKEQETMDDLTIFLRSWSTKAACKMLVKLTPAEVNFINFYTQIFRTKLQSCDLSLKFFWRQNFV